MVFRLPYGDYNILLDILANLRYNLVVDSVVDGNTPAWVYCDSQTSPKAALVWNRQDALLVAGSTGDGKLISNLAQVIKNEIVLDAHKRQIPHLSLHFNPQTWSAKVGRLLDGFEPQIVKRRFYSATRPKFDWQAHLPKNARIEPIDRSILQGNRLENHEGLLGWVRSFWPSEEHFLENGFGYCLVNDGEIASWCLTVYASGDHYELAVETIPEFRGRGYATLVAGACVERCIKDGFAPHWHSDETNRSSIAVAQKVGFDKPMGYSVYRFEISEQLIL